MTDPNPRIAGAGLLALDVILSDLGDAEALTFAGGTCGNVLSILSYLRWTATPIGFVGDDPAGTRVLADLTSTGVGAAHLIQSSNWTTPVYVQRLDRDHEGQPSHDFTRTSVCPHCGEKIGALQDRNDGATPIKRFAEAEKVDVFFMDRLSDDILSLAESAHSRGALVFYEPSAKSDVPFWHDAFGLVDIVKYSVDRFDEQELRPYLHKARQAIWEVQTLGAQGLKYRHHPHRGTKSARWVKSDALVAARVVDTCGAGDWCSAGLIHGFVASDQRRDAISFANSVRFGQLLAAWACAFVGARGAMYCNDPTTTWLAISALIDSRELDVSRLPTNTQSKPQAADAMHSCIKALCSQA